MFSSKYCSNCSPRQEQGGKGGNGGFFPVLFLSYSNSGKIIIDYLLQHNGGVGERESGAYFIDR